MGILVPGDKITLKVGLGQSRYVVPTAENVRGVKFYVDTAPIEHEGRRSDVDLNAFWKVIFNACDFA
jgi:hypothetical protein